MIPPTINHPAPRMKRKPARDCALRCYPEPSSCLAGLAVGPARGPAASNVKRNDKMFERLKGWISETRIVRFGDREIITDGLRLSFWADISHRCMTASWPSFIIGAATVFAGNDTFPQNLTTVMPTTSKVAAPTTPARNWTSVSDTVRPAYTDRNVLPKSRTTRRKTLTRQIVGSLIGARCSEGLHTTWL